MKASISEVVFGQLEDGSIIKQYQLRNARGSVATFLNLGASWVGFQRASDQESLVLGCTSAETFAKQHAFLGSTVGRWANRIANGQIKLQGQTIQLEVNLPPHHLHGGKQGFSNQIWQSHIQLLNDQTPTLTFTYFSPVGEGGFPGNITATVTITLTEEDTVRFAYHATTDAETIFNITNHSYFNLDGQSFGSLKNHQFKLESQTYLEADETALPTGTLLSSNNSVLDFSDWASAHDHLAPLSDPQLKRAGGYDHCFCFAQDGQLKTLASAKCPEKNLKLTCKSDLPGMQFYTSNFLGGTPVGDGSHFKTHGAFCFEPGLWPDSPNHEHFPECVIDPDHDFSAIIEYSFETLE